MTHKEEVCIRTAKKFLASTVKAVKNIKLDPSSFAAAVEAIAGCRHKNKIVTTGMGKAGHIARKVASSLSSLTFSACYLHPGEAAHGDVGVIRSGDVLLAFSTSGKTREVLETIEFSKKLGISKVISITSHSDGPIRNLSDIILDMGPIIEAGHLSMAPTTSIVVMLVIADMLALTAAEEMEVSRFEYGLRHHGGYLGQKCRGEVK